MIIIIHRRYAMKGFVGDIEDQAEVILISGV
jgi:hypothetical protein